MKIADIKAIDSTDSLSVVLWRKTTYLEVHMLRYQPKTEGYIFLPRAIRPEVKKYIPRSEVYHLGIYTDQEVVFLHNFDIPPPYPFFKL